MVPNSIFTPDLSTPLAPARQRDLMQRLVAAAATALNAQLDEFSGRLAAALLAASETVIDARSAALRLEAGSLLQKNGYPFYHVASAALRDGLQDAVAGFDRLVQQASHSHAAELALVPYEEMENRLRIERAAKPLDATHAAVLATLNLRLAAVLGREQIAASENPFRPAVLIAAMDCAWREFSPDPASHVLLLEQSAAGVLLDPGPALQAVDQVLIAAGVLPGLVDNLSIRKSVGKRNPAASAKADPALMRQVRQLFSATAAPSAAAEILGTAGAANAQAGAGTAQAGARTVQPAGAPVHIAPALATFLREMQQRATAPHSSPAARHAYRLSELQQTMPREAMTRADEAAVDVMSRVFEAVFRDPNIPPEMKELIGFLQIPVLKAALIDKEFFFEDAHPVRRLISLMTSSSVGWDASKGQADPLYQAIRQNVHRVQKFDSEMTLFADVVSDLEDFLKEEDGRATTRLAAPIDLALKQEHLREATRCATSDVAARVASGEVAVFVETFLENRWIPVLTLAHSVKAEKPQVLDSAIRTMDELIWSVQPKITAAQRKELVGKLPALLATLNKWLNVVKWDDADRLQFFADLAECHASIVRAPLELSPQRQLELAVEAAKKAAERRFEKRAAEAALARVVPDAAEQQVAALERGVWLEFQKPQAAARRVKLAWVSPLKSLYIFTTVHREEAFSLAADALAATFREGRVRLVAVDGFVDRALAEAVNASLDSAPETESVPA